SFSCRQISRSARRRTCRRSRKDRHPSSQFRHVPLDRRRPRFVVHVLSVPPRLDEPRTRELFEVMRDRGLPDWKTVTEPLATNLPALCYVLENLYATGI